MQTHKYKLGQTVFIDYQYMAIIEKLFDSGEYRVRLIGYDIVDCVNENMITPIPLSVSDSVLTTINMLGGDGLYHKGDYPNEDCYCRYDGNQICITKDCVVAVCVDDMFKPMVV